MRTARKETNGTSAARGRLVGRVVAVVTLTGTAVLIDGGTRDRPGRRPRGAGVAARPQGAGHLGPLLRPRRRRRHRPAAAGGLSRPLPPRLDRQELRGPRHLAAHGHQLQGRRRRPASRRCTSTATSTRTRSRAARSPCTRRGTCAKWPTGCEWVDSPARRADVLHRADHQSRRPRGVSSRSRTTPHSSAHRRGAARRRRRRAGRRGRLRRSRRRRPHHPDASPRPERALARLAGGSAPDDPGRGRTEPGEYEMLGNEGFDNDGDGLVNEDGIADYYDPNRNWPWHWQPQLRAGRRRLPTRIPPRDPGGDAISCIGHPNIAGVQTYHNSGGMILRGPGVRSDEYRRRMSGSTTPSAEVGETILPGYKLRRHLERSSTPCGATNSTGSTWAAASSVQQRALDRRSSTSRSRPNGTSTTGRSTSSTGCCCSGGGGAVDAVQPPPVRPDRGRRGQEAVHTGHPRLPAPRRGAPEHGVHGVPGAARCRWSRWTRSPSGRWAAV